MRKQSTGITYRDIGRLLAEQIALCTLRIELDDFAPAPSREDIVNQNKKERAFLIYVANQITEMQKEESK